MRVPWMNLSSNEYEAMVAVLLNLIHPESQRIDGSGGDGGRDVQLPLEDGLHIFEMKGFTGRITQSRRRQIKRSLARAAAHDPVKWTLVVPIDPTPGEVQWFDKLRLEYSFEIEWNGMTWLDAQVAQKPYVCRYFVEGAADEVVRLLGTLREEEADLKGRYPPSSPASSSSRRAT